MKLNFKSIFSSSLLSCKYEKLTQKPQVFNLFAWLLFAWKNHSIRVLFNMFSKKSHSIRLLFNVQKSSFLIKSSWISQVKYLKKSYFSVQIYQRAIKPSLRRIFPLVIEPTGRQTLHRIENRESIAAFLVFTEIQSGFAKKSRKRTKMAKKWFFVGSGVFGILDNYGPEKIYFNRKQNEASSSFNGKRITTKKSHVLIKTSTIHITILFKK